MSEELNMLKKENEDLKINNRVLAVQVNAHKDVINGLMTENLNARTNFTLSQQYLGESVQQSTALKAEVEKLKKENEELKKQVEELKVPAESDSPVTADAA